MADKIRKEQIRKAMLEAKKKHSSIKKIEHPLARYNELDQLVCVICKIVVRNEAVWPVHLSSKAHKDKIALAIKLKSQPTESPKTAAADSKRSSTFSEPQPYKKVKGILKNSEQTPVNIKASLPADFFEKSTNLSSTAPKTNPVKSSSSDNLGKSNLDEKEIKEKDNKEVPHSSIPEGFFDDPEMDAKARNVEYKNPKEEEWEKFLKEIKEEEVQSAQIIEEDLEEVAKERQLEVVDEQLRCWSNFMNLVEKKELLQQKKKEVKIFEKCESSSSDEDSDDSEDTNEWRKKKIV